MTNTNFPTLEEGRRTFLELTTEIAIGNRANVARVIELGQFLNDLYDEHFGPGRPHATQWTRTLEEWEADPRTVANYRQLAEEVRRDPTGWPDYDGLTDAYRWMRQRRRHRKAIEARAEAEAALDASVEAARAAEGAGVAAEKRAERLRTRAGALDARAHRMEIKAGLAPATARTAGQRYQVLVVDFDGFSAHQIAKHPIGDLAADDAVLYVWEPAPGAESGLHAAMRRWGARSAGRPLMTWARFDPVEWAIGEVSLLTFVRGAGVAPAAQCALPRFLEMKESADLATGEEVDAHALLRDALDTMFPDHTKLAVFDTAAAPGWHGLADWQPGAVPGEHAAHAAA